MPRIPKRCFSKAAICRQSGQTSSPLDAETHDVVIVGAGAAGLALASALTRPSSSARSCRIALVEASDLSKVREWSLPSDQYSNRVSSVTNRSLSFLKTCDLHSHLNQTRTNSIQEMEVWDGVSDARISFRASELLGREHSTNMSTMMENLNLQRSLLKTLQSNSSIILLDKTKVDSIAKPNDDANSWPLITLDNGRVLRARLLVGADGFNSPVRRFAGIDCYGWSYDTQAVVATLFHPSRSTGNTTAFQRFLPTGPIAFLPLSPTISSLVWSTKPHIASSLRSVHPDVLSLMINAAFRLPQISLQYLYDYISEKGRDGLQVERNELADEIRWREAAHSIQPYSALSSTSDKQGDISEGFDLLPPLVEHIQAGSVASFPLRFNHAETYLGEGLGSRTVLVGDAAHSLHPLAGQGLNLALGDVEELASCIDDAISHGIDFGSRTALLPYVRNRYFENHKVMSAVDKLHKLYSSQLPPVVWARSVGLEVVNELDSLKTALMLSAGADSRTTPNPWNAAADGVTLVNNGIEFLKTGASVISGTVGSAVRNVLKV
ncbi:ubiquinone biosynthesis hydrox [Sistotremastrum suecicum HHB10207 ss-3]|uniref:Ubiquinone biosynthesis monooxygenase COQ6, mitochondrial n=1 Tax=Sistotremastrum suecicum HHB10207 ss-3 TaxID=1314776 RepID=A0A166CRG5_9AGAM|nr:ubiquinone biosynthesis hydrox [Sistotremastrum suecicum HHB10207 ss-3]